MPKVIFPTLTGTRWLDKEEKLINKTMTPVATGRRGPNRGAARAGAIGFLGLALFQAALALGAPLGTAAWGEG
jgi:hypothetical protein